MKITSIALKEHTQLEETSLTTCWKATLTNGTIYGFTDYDLELTIDSLIYYPQTGYTPSAIDSSSEFNVDNMEVDGAITSTVITEQDILAGIWDFAKIEVFVVNNKDPNNGKIYSRAGWFGEITTGKTAFHAELRGMTQKLQQSIGRVLTASCDATFGDSRCGVVLTPYTFTGTVTGITNQKSFQSAALTSPTGSFNYGLLTWVTGSNQTIKIEIKSYTVGAVELQLPCPRTIQLGDSFTAVWGCSKRFVEDCTTLYANTVNFRGFPYVPGVDQLTKGLT